MELTQKVECWCRVAATYQESGELSVKVFAQAEYAKGRTTTAEVTDIPEALTKRLREVCAEILGFASVALGPRLARAIHTSAEVAARHGET